MDIKTVFAKTEKGEEEIRNRTYKLAQRLRTMLIMVDGAATAGELAAKAQSLGVPEDFLEQLVGSGFIAPTAAAVSAPQAPAAGAAAPSTPPAEPMSEDEFGRFVAAQKFMNATVSDKLGFRGLPVVLKIERASSRKELQALVAELTEKLAKALGPQEAKNIIAQLTALLS